MMILSTSIEAIVVNSEIDRCGALVPRIRGAWQGLTGGWAGREELALLFQELAL